MINEKQLIEILQKNSIFEKITNAEGKNIYEIIDDLPKVGEWIPCIERLPKPEEEVYVCAKRKYRGGDIRYIYTTAIYEDGTVSEHDSCWNWEEIEGEWDEENDCYIVPEGWWEDKHYNPDGVLNYPIYDEVIAWMPLPEPCNADMRKEVE